MEKVQEIQTVEKVEMDFPKPEYENEIMGEENYPLLTNKKDNTGP